MTRPGLLPPFPLAYCLPCIGVYVYMGYSVGSDTDVIPVSQVFELTFPALKYSHVGLLLLSPLLACTDGTNFKHSLTY
jgi:hypothetical protein